MIDRIKSLFVKLKSDKPFKMTSEEDMRVGETSDGFSSVSSSLRQETSSISPAFHGHIFDLKDKPTSQQSEMYPANLFQPHSSSVVSNSAS